MFTEYWFDLYTGLQYKALCIMYRTPNNVGGKWRVYKDWQYGW